MELVLTPSQLAIFDFARGAGAVGTPSSENVRRTLADLFPVRGPALVAGGIAVIHFGYVRSTRDIDILCPKYDEADILRRLETNFKMVLKATKGLHHLVHSKTNVRVKLIPEGVLTTCGSIPAPKTVGGDNGFISLFGLVWMKLVSGRTKDDADVVEVAKSGHLAEMKTFVSRLPDELRARYNEILARAEREQHTDMGRIENAERAEEPPARYGKRKSKSRK